MVRFIDPWIGLWSIKFSKLGFNLCAFNYCSVKSGWPFLHFDIVLIIKHKGRQVQHDFFLLWKYLYALNSQQVVRGRAKKCQTRLVLGMGGFQETLGLGNPKNIARSNRF